MTLSEHREEIRSTELVNARDQLAGALRMLDLLEELLEMQDQVLGQMGAFTKG